MVTHTALKNPEDMEITLCGQVRTKEGVKGMMLTLAIFVDNENFAASKAELEKRTAEFHTMKVTNTPKRRKDIN